MTFFKKDNQIFPNIIMKPRTWLIVAVCTLLSFLPVGIVVLVALFRPEHLKIYTISLFAVTDLLFIIFSLKLARKTIGTWNPLPGF